MIGLRWLVPSSLLLFLGLVPAAAVAAEPRDAGPTGPLRLQQALALALKHHPGLAADSWELRAREAEILQAGRRPIPELEVELENVAGSGALRGLDGLETTLALSALIELGGKRTGRIRETEAGQSVAAWDAEIRRIDVMSGVAVAFVEVLAAQERVGLADSLASIAEGVLVSVGRRVRAGGVSPVEERRARVSRETALVARDRAVQQLQAARARLAAHWAGTAEFSAAEGRLEVLGPEIPGPESLSARVAENPDLGRWTAEIESRNAERARAAADGTPDLALRGGLRHLNEAGETALVFGVGFPVPWLDRNRDAASAAGHRVRRAELERQLDDIRIRLQLTEAHAALTAARAEAVALRDRVLPEADAALVESRTAYERGRLRLTDVLDAERTAFELRDRYVEVLADYHIRVAGLERLLGSPLNGPWDTEEQP